jgi:peptidyl-prolyl cis-trans isomerase SurA
MKYMKVAFRHIIGILLIVCGHSLSGQEVIDRILAVVGEEIILESDLNNQYNYLKINGQKDDGNLRCQVLDQLIVSKLLLDKAQQDSIIISDEQVESEITRRVQYTISNLGNEKRFEEIYGKSVAQFRQDVRPDIKNELLIDRMRGMLISEQGVTPREVKQFYNSLNKDSLGYLPAEVQLNHIVIIPPFDGESKREAREYLEDVRKEILEEDKDFGFMAIEHSEGPSAPRGGHLGEIRRGQMVPEFEEMIYSMREGEVSEVFETDFGFHIAKVHKIKGQVVDGSHILRIPKRSANADSIAMDSLRKVLELVATDSLTFEQAAIRYSMDRGTKDCGGCISDPQTGELRISLDKLDPDLYFKIEEMKEGEISDPLEYEMPDGTNAFHVLYLKRKVPPHVPNLRDDYKKIQQAALQLKQAEKFEGWLESAKKNIYIDIKPNECANALKSWME